MSAERVYAVFDSYDGIRSGVADYLGSPHHFEREWSEELQEFLPTFLLTRISTRMLEDVLESHAIFRAWEERFHLGEVEGASHPVNPRNDERFLELDSRIKAAIADPSARTNRAIAKFVPLPGQPTRPKGVLGEFSVEWHPVV